MLPLSRQAEDRWRALLQGLGGLYRVQSSLLAQSPALRPRLVASGFGAESSEGRRIMMFTCRHIKVVRGRCDMLTRTRSSALAREAVSRRAVEGGAVHRQPGAVHPLPPLP